MSGDPDEMAACVRRATAESPATREALWQEVLQARADLWAPQSKAPDIARRLILDGMPPDKAVAAADLLAE